MIGPDTPLNMCGISGGIHARLWRAGITTIGALAACSRDELIGTDDIGPGTVAAVAEFLAGHGYRLAAEADGSKGAVYEQRGNYYHLKAPPPAP